MEDKMKNSELSSVKNALRILRSFTMENNQKGVLEISRELGISKSSVHRILQTLATEGFVKKARGSSKYELGLSVVELNSIYLHHLDIYEESHNSLIELTKKTGETSHLAVLENENIVYLNKVEFSPSHGIKSHIGHHNYIHCTGTGKVLLAYSEPDVLNRILQKPLERVTDKTITDPQVLLKELEKVKSLGYGIARGESRDQITSIAVPIKNYKGNVIAAINLVGQSGRFNDEKIKYYLNLLLDEAATISRRIGYLNF